MALPKVSNINYELVIPSTGEKVTYRPFLVKEEKVLLIALESGEISAMTKAMQDIITSCTDGKVNTKTLAPFDIEYFFLQLRGRSVGEIIEINLPRPENFNCCKKSSDNDTCNVKIPIDDIKINTSKIPESKIILTETISIQMKYPTIITVQKYTNNDGNLNTENVFNLINECIEYIQDDEEIFKTKDHTTTEITTFIESLNSSQFTKIREWLEGMPKLTHSVNWVCEHCEKSKKIQLEGVDSFFG
jgi:rubrerythrin